MKKVLTIMFLFCAIMAAAQDGRQLVAIYMAGDEPPKVRWTHKTLGAEFAKAITENGAYLATDRTETIIQQIGREHAPWRSDAISSNQIKTLGELLNAQYICVIGINEIKGARSTSYYLEVRLIDAATAKVLRVVSIDSDLKDTGEIMRVAKQTAHGLTVTRDVPLINTGMPKPEEFAAISILTESIPADIDTLKPEKPIVDIDSISEFEEIAAGSVSSENLSESPRQVCPYSSAFVLPALNLSYNMRSGYRKFDDVKELQRTDNRNVVMFGLGVGKRKALKNPMLRMQSTAEFLWGDVKDDEFFAEQLDGSPIGVGQYGNYMTAGTVAEIHHLFPVDHIRRYFLSVGAGIHVNSFFYSFKTQDGIEIETWRSERIVTVSPSLNIGGGLEKINQKSAVVIGYNFRLWQPTRYMEVGSLFPMGAEYREVFFSHTIQFQLLLPKLRKSAVQDTSNSPSKNPVPD